MVCYELIDQKGSHAEANRRCYFDLQMEHSLQPIPSIPSNTSAKDAEAEEHKEGDEFVRPVHPRS